MHDLFETITIFQGLDIETTSQFYSKALGVKEVLRDADHLIMRHDCGYEIHFWYCPIRRAREGSGCYSLGCPLDALHDEYLALGFCVEEGRCSLSIAEFYIYDPLGNILRYGRLSDEISH